MVNMLVLLFLMCTIGCVLVGICVNGLLFGLRARRLYTDCLCLSTSYNDAKAMISDKRAVQHIYVRVIGTERRGIAA